MLDAKIIEELQNLKTSESYTIGEYNIVVRVLTLKEIMKYAEQLKVIFKSKDMDLVSVLSDATDIINECVTINNGAVKLVDLATPIALVCVEEWIKLNFMKKDLILAPINRALTTVSGQEVKIEKILAAFLSLSSTVDTATETTSSNLQLTKSE